MNVTQVSIGRFHHFHLARQMEKFGILDRIFTGYPKFKLKDEQGIDQNKIKTFPWIHAPYMKSGFFLLNKSVWLTKQWEWIDRYTLDKYVASRINKPTILISLSGCGLYSGNKTKKKGGIYICDRGSSHIRFQDKILNEEYEKWGFKFKGVDPRVITKEEKEYDLADIITVPSEFVKQSFIKMGIVEDKIVKIPYGARLDRFKKTANPKESEFRILWVGGVSIRKGFMYALKAFQDVKHPKKEFIVVGNIENEIKTLIEDENLENVSFKGIIENSKLPDLYSSSHVFMLASLEEGLAMVQGEALACGCPVLSTTNTGASDLFTDGKEGFIVPIRSSVALHEKLQYLADHENVRKEMSTAALERVKELGGWDTYGNNWKNLIDSFNL